MMEERGRREGEGSVDRKKLQCLISFEDKDFEEGGGGGD